MVISKIPAYSYIGNWSDMTGDVTKALYGIGLNFLHLQIQGTNYGYVQIT